MIFIKYAGVLCLLLNMAFTQMLTSPRIISGKFDRWFLERSLREYLDIPYSTVFIKSLQPQGLVQLDDPVFMMVKSLIKQAVDERDFSGIITNWIRPMMDAMDVIHYKGVIVIYMPKDMEIHLSCRFVDILKHGKLYFNQCEGLIMHSGLQHHSESDIEGSFIQSKELFKYLPELCRNNCFDKNLKLPLINLLDVKNNMPRDQKPFIHYSTQDKIPWLDEMIVRHELFFQDDGQINLDGDFYSYVHPYLNHGRHVGLMSEEDIPLPGRSEAILLEENSSLSIVRIPYESDKAYCLIADMSISSDKSMKKMFWERHQFYSFSTLTNDIPSHLFEQQYMLMSPGRGVTLSMTCHNSFRLSIQEFLAILGDKLTFIVLPR